jgi:hypothetical protein
MYTKKLTQIFITFTTFLAVMGSMAAGTVSTADSATPIQPSLVMNYARPLSFEPNRGQADEQVDFLAHGSAYNLFLSHGDAVMVFQRGATGVRMKPVGANYSAPPDALDQQPSKSNYFIGNVPGSWHTGIPNYSQIRYRNVYPGVDLVYHGDQGRLEYDFVVTSGADPRRILIDFRGATKLKVDRSGNLVAHTSAGDLRWRKPIAYQRISGNRRFVACAYTRKGDHRLGFALAAYDRTEPLVIDPVLEYSTYLGGSGGDVGLAIAVDSSGDAYATGSTGSTDFPVKNAFQNSWNGSFNGTPNVFVTKFDVLGNLVYSTYLGGSGAPAPPFYGDVGNGIAVDPHGNAYITGSTGSFDFPTKNAFQPGLGCHTVFCSSLNAFVTKLNANGNGIVFSTYLGGTGNSQIGPIEAGRGIALDTHGNVYVTGSATSFDFPLKNAFQSTPGGIFVTKFNAAGTALVYSTYLGVGRDSGNGIAVDSSGNAYVTGHTDDPDFPTRNAFQEKRKSYGGNAFLTKFDAAGTALVYSTYLGGSGSGGDSGNGIAVDSEGHAFVTGVTHSTDFPLKNAFQRKLKSTGEHAFVTKFHYDGVSLFYSTYLGGSGSDTGNAIAVDSGDHPFVTGFTTSPDFPTAEAFQTKLKSTGGNAFVTKFHFDGVSLFYSSYLGGSGSDSGSGIAVDKDGNAYVTGNTSSPDFPTKNAFQPMLGAPAAHNAFVTKISAQ